MTEGKDVGWGLRKQQQYVEGHSLVQLPGSHPVTPEHTVSFMAGLGEIGLFIHSNNM